HTREGSRLVRQLRAVIDDVPEAVHLPPSSVEHRSDPGGCGQGLQGCLCRRFPAGDGAPAGGAAADGREIRFGDLFESLALNEASADTAGAAGDAAADAARDVGPAGDPGAANLELLGRYTAQLAAAFEVRHKLLASRGRALPGAVAAVTAVAGLPGVVQSVLTGTIRPNAAVKLAVFGLSRYIDVDIGGYGSEIYPMGAQLLRIRGRAAEKYGTTFDAHNTVYLADSSR